MLPFEVQVGPSTRPVACRAEVVLAGDGQSGRVVVDGQTYTVAFDNLGRVVVNTGDASYAVTLEPRAPSWAGHVAGHTHALRVEPHHVASLRRALAANHRHAGGETEIRAPMPGRIVKIAVAPGDSVEAGSPLIIMEAMKMENEIQAVAEAKVDQSVCEVGAAVEAGALLLTLAPAR